MPRDKGFRPSFPTAGSSRQAAKLAFQAERRFWEEGWIWLIVPVMRGRAGEAAAHRLTAPSGPFERVPCALR